MKIKRMMAGVLAVVSVFCMSTTAMAAAPAQALNSIERQREARIEEAEAIAYMDLDSASVEMQERILKARETIIDSKSWVANGYEATLTRKDGTVLKIPHFSELFPGWDVPVCESAVVMSSSSIPEFVSPFEQAVIVSLNRATSTTNTDPSFIVSNIKNTLEVYVNKLYTSTSCNLGFTNTDLNLSVAHMVDMLEGDHLGVDAVPGTVARIAVRASTYVTPGRAELGCYAW